MPRLPMPCLSFSITKEPAHTQPASLLPHNSAQNEYQKIKKHQLNNRGISSDNTNNAENIDQLHIQQKLLIQLDFFIINIKKCTTPPSS